VLSGTGTAAPAAVGVHRLKQKWLLHELQPPIPPVYTHRVVSVGSVSVFKQAAKLAYSGIWRTNQIIRQTRKYHIGGDAMLISPKV
jgi:hypothetical protein